MGLLDRRLTFEEKHAITRIALAAGVQDDAVRTVLEALQTYMMSELYAGNRSITVPGFVRMWVSLDETQGRPQVQLVLAADSPIFENLLRLLRGEITPVHKEIVERFSKGMRNLMQTASKLQLEDSQHQHALATRR